VEESVPERTNAKDPAPLKIKEVWVENRRYVVCLNEEERRKDFGASGGIGHYQLRQGDKSLVGNKGYRRYLKVQGVASGDDGVALAKRLGAEFAINGRKDDVVAAAREFASGGVDAALVTAGGRRQIGR
jgi:NADPH2:quinone reductase